MCTWAIEASRTDCTFCRTSQQGVATLRAGIAGARSKQRLVEPCFAWCAVLCTSLYCGHAWWARLARWTARVLAERSNDARLTQSVGGISGCLFRTVASDRATIARWTCVRPWNARFAFARAVRRICASNVTSKSEQYNICGNSKREMMHRRWNLALCRHLHTTFTYGYSVIKQLKHKQ